MSSDNTNSGPLASREMKSRSVEIETVFLKPWLQKLSQHVHSAVPGVTPDTVGGLCCYSGCKQSEKEGGKMADADTQVAGVSCSKNC